MNITSNSAINDLNVQLKAAQKTEFELQEQLENAENETITKEKDINDVVVRVVPKLEPFVQTIPTSFSELKEGEYLFEVTVTDKISRKKKIRDALFEVVKN